MLGPTAVGKSAVLLSIHNLVDAVIYADVWVGYKDLNIGVAKPKPQDLSVVPHYFVNTLELNEQCTVVDFVRCADNIISKLAQQNKRVIVVGGSLFYLRHFLYGMPATPEASPKTREYVSELLKKHGKYALYEHLKVVDPISATRVSWQDSYRVTRSLEVYYDSGRPSSSFLLERRDFRPMYNFFLVELTRSREELYERINDRVEMMWKDGLVQEVNRLKEKGFSLDLPSSRAIGYKEFFEEHRSLSEVKELIKKNTRNYAKRQLTFLRSMPIDSHIAADDTLSLTETVMSFFDSYHL